MRQLTLARQVEFQRYSKKTRREQFLDDMERVMPWAGLLSLVTPHYSKGETGRKPVGLAIMLRVHFLQQWFALSDAGVEDALHDRPCCGASPASIRAGRPRRCRMLNGQLLKVT
jgi:IS5 family transposase